VCENVCEAVCTSFYKWKRVCASGREGKLSCNAVTAFKTEKMSIRLLLKVNIVIQNNS